MMNPPSTPFRYASDIMTPRPHCAQTTDLVKDLQDYFEKYQISSIPVLTPEGKLVGLVSSLDIAKARRAVDNREFLELVLEGTGFPVDQLETFYHLDSYEQLTMEEIMSPNPPTALETDSIASISQLMVRQHMHRVVVLNPTERVVGIISSLDIIRACFPEAHA